MSSPVSNPTQNPVQLPQVPHQNPQPKNVYKVGESRVAFEEMGIQDNLIRMKVTFTCDKHVKVMYAYASHQAAAKGNEEQEMIIRRTLEIYQVAIEKGLMDNIAKDGFTAFASNTYVHSGKAISGKTISTGKRCKATPPGECTWDWADNTRFSHQIAAELKLNRVLTAASKALPQNAPQGDEKANKLNELVRELQYEKKVSKRIHKKISGPLDENSLNQLMTLASTDQTKALIKGKASHKNIVAFDETYEAILNEGQAEKQKKMLKELESHLNAIDDVLEIKKARQKKFDELKGII